MILAVDWDIKRKTLKFAICYVLVGLGPLKNWVFIT